MRVTTIKTMGRCEQNLRHADRLRAHQDCGLMSVAEEEGSIKTLAKPIEGRKGKD